MIQNFENMRQRSLRIEKEHQKKEAIKLVIQILKNELENKIGVKNSKEKTRKFLSNLSTSDKRKKYMGKISYKI